MKPDSDRSPAASPKWTQAVKRVLILGDGQKRSVEDTLGPMVAWLREREIEVHVEPDVRAFSEQHSPPQPCSPPPADLVVVLGGDGSVLTAVRAFRDQPVPVLGVHFGRVGFLAPVLGDAWKAGLTEVLAGECLVESRMRLEVEMPSGDRYACLNDAVVARPAASAMVALQLDVDGQQATEYHADGLIVATASGSTAYSLAAGGPILAPELQGLVVTPISAHALAHRPLILSANSVVEVGVKRGATGVAVVLDGQEIGRLAVGERVTMRRSPLDYPLLVPSQLNPWRRLSDRLGWKGSL